MYIITAVDDGGGMLFNHRRQSRDRIMNEKILSITKGHLLWMNKYSYALFEPLAADGDIWVDDDFLSQAGKGDYCFVEDNHVQSYMDKIEGIFLFRWNRRYPGDFFIDLDFKDPVWKLAYTEEFEGSSQDKITMEVYKKET